LPCSRRDKAGEKTSALHGEWFAITEEMAIQTVKRWECFMQQQNPYAWDGNLSIVWRYLVEQKSPAVTSYGYRLRLCLSIVCLQHPQSCSRRGIENQAVPANVLLATFVDTLRLIHVGIMSQPCRILCVCRCPWMRQRDSTV